MVPGYCPGPFHGDPSGIRTRVTAVRGQRTRPLYDGAKYFPAAFPLHKLSEYFTHFAMVSNRLTGWKPTDSLPRKGLQTRAGIPGLEPRMTVPETVVLPITPYPNGTFGPDFRAFSLLRAPQHEKLLYPRLRARTNRRGPAFGAGRKRYQPKPLPAVRRCGYPRVSYRSVTSSCPSIREPMRSKGPPCPPRFRHRTLLSGGS